jgi:hypothetical protein
MITAILKTLLAATVSINPQNTGPSALMLLNFIENLKTNAHNSNFGECVIFSKRP